MRPDEISIVILTWNEEANIERVLAPLLPFREVIVIDSESGDSTVALCQKFHNVKVYQRPFDSHSIQWNYGLSKASNAWILSLDADYVLTPELLREIEMLDPGEDAYRASFIYCIEGTPLKGAILPPRTVLFRKSKSRYIQDGHTQKLVVDGTIGRLTHPLYHDDRKPLARWLQAQERYTDLEKDKLLSEQNISSRSDRIRKSTILAPFLVFVYCYLWKGGFRSGRRGLFYALQRSYVELLTTLKIMESRIKSQKYS